MSSSWFTPTSGFTTIFLRRYILLNKRTTSISIWVYLDLSFDTCSRATNNYFFQIDIAYWSRKVQILGRYVCIEGKKKKCRQFSLCGCVEKRFENSISSCTLTVNIGSVQTYILEAIIWDFFLPWKLTIINAHPLAYYNTILLYYYYYADVTDNNNNGK